MYDSVYVWLYVYMIIYYVYAIHRYIFDYIVMIIYVYDYIHIWVYVYIYIERDIKDPRMVHDIIIEAWQLTPGLKARADTYSAAMAACSKAKSWDTFHDPWGVGKEYPLVSSNMANNGP